MLGTLVLEIVLAAMSLLLLLSGVRSRQLSSPRRKAYLGSAALTFLVAMSLQLELLGWGTASEVTRLFAAALTLSAIAGIRVLTHHYEQEENGVKETVREEHEKARRDRLEHSAGLGQRLETVERNLRVAQERLIAQAMAGKATVERLQAQERAITSSPEIDAVLASPPQHATINGWLKTLDLMDDCLAWVVDADGVNIRVAGGGAQKWFGFASADAVGTRLVDWGEPSHISAFDALKKNPSAPPITKLLNFNHYPNAGTWLTCFGSVLTDGEFDGMYGVALRAPGMCLKCVAPLPSPRSR